MKPITPNNEMVSPLDPGFSPLGDQILKLRENCLDPNEFLLVMQTITLKLHQEKYVRESTTNLQQQRRVNKTPPIRVHHCLNEVLESNKSLIMDGKEKRLFLCYENFLLFKDRTPPGFSANFEFFRVLKEKETKLDYLAPFPQDGVLSILKQIFRKSDKCKFSIKSIVDFQTRTSIKKMDSVKTPKFHLYSKRTSRDIVKGYNKAIEEKKEFNTGGFIYSINPIFDMKFIDRKFEYYGDFFEIHINLSCNPKLKKESNFFSPTRQNFEVYVSEVLDEAYVNTQKVGIVDGRQSNGNSNGNLTIRCSATVGDGEFKFNCFSTSRDTEYVVTVMWRPYSNYFLFKKEHRVKMQGNFLVEDEMEEIKTPKDGNFDIDEFDFFKVDQDTMFSEKDFPNIRENADQNDFFTYEDLYFNGNLDESAYFNSFLFDLVSPTFTKKEKIVSRKYVIEMIRRHIQKLDFVGNTLLAHCAARRLTKLTKLICSMLSAKNIFRKNNFGQDCFYWLNDSTFENVRKTIREELGKKGLEKKRTKEVPKKNEEEKKKENVLNEFINLDLGKLESVFQSKKESGNIEVDNDLEDIISGNKKDTKFELSSILDSLSFNPDKLKVKVNEVYYPIKNQFGFDLCTKGIDVTRENEKIEGEFTHENGVISKNSKNWSRVSFDLFQIGEGSMSLHVKSKEFLKETKVCVCLISGKSIPMVLPKESSVFICDKGAVGFSRLRISVKEGSVNVEVDGKRYWDVNLKTVPRFFSWLKDEQLEYSLINKEVQVNVKVGSVISFHPSFSIDLIKNLESEYQHSYNVKKVIFEENQ